MRNELDAAEDGLARANAFVSLGQFERALPLVDRAVLAGEHAGSPGVIARALVVRGECEDRLGRSSAALATYQRAAKTAAQARDQTVVADSLSRAFLVDGDHLGHRADALRTQPFVELALDSAGQPDTERAQWLHFLAILLYEDPSRVDEAAVDEHEALAIRQRTLPPNHVYIFDSIETLANIEVERKHFDESKRLLEQVLAGRVAARGPNDSSVSAVYTNFGVLEIGRGDLPAAIGYLQRAVDIARSAGRPNTVALFNLGVSQLALGRWSAAATSLSVSLEASERVGGAESRDVGESAMFLGIAWIARGDFERGRPMLLRGLDVVRRSGSPLLTTALMHVARLALHDGDRQKVHALLAEAMKLPADAPLQTLVAAELTRAEAGCAAARPMFAKALDSAVAGDDRFARSLATVELAECEIATGESRTAQQRLEAELASLAKANADDIASAPARAALAKVQR